MFDTIRLDTSRVSPYYIVIVAKMFQCVGPANIPFFPGIGSQGPFQESSKVSQQHHSLQLGRPPSQWLELRRKCSRSGPQICLSFKKGTLQRWDLDFPPSNLFRYPTPDTTLPTLPCDRTAAPLGVVPGGSFWGGSPIWQSHGSSCLGSWAFPTCPPAFRSLRPRTRRRDPRPTRRAVPRC